MSVCGPVGCHMIETRRLYFASLLWTTETLTGTVNSHGYPIYPYHVIFFLLPFTDCSSDNMCIILPWDTCSGLMLIKWLNQHGGCPRGVMVKAMVCEIVVREFVLQSRYYVHFRANTLGKGMNPLILPAMG